MNTKTILKDSLFRLMQVRSFEKITVQDILDDSGVSRSTFYRHFKDKYDLMNWFYISKVDSILQNEAPGNWPKKIYLIADFIYENRIYFQKAGKVQGDNSFWHFFYDYGYSTYSELYLKGSGLDQLDPFAKVTLEFNCAGNVRVIRHWLLRGCDIPVKDIAHYMYQLIPELLRQYM